MLGITTTFYLFKMKPSREKNGTSSCKWIIFCFCCYCCRCLYFMLRRLKKKLKFIRIFFCYFKAKKKNSDQVLWRITSLQNAILLSALLMITTAWQKQQRLCFFLLFFISSRCMLQQPFDFISKVEESKKTHTSKNTSCCISKND